MWLSRYATTKVTPQQYQVETLLVTKTKQYAFQRKSFTSSIEKEGGESFFKQQRKRES